ncbi:hypothetical protein VTN31DRAFT_6405 [Thermomyces dupontii]|uniref:uncharacterized protein n=1 Tax=Talaromyces thermophilus TaxID=28565 RepID=UPI0037428734
MPASSSISARENYDSPSRDDHPSPGVPDSFALKPLSEAPQGARGTGPPLSWDTPNGAVAPAEQRRQFRVTWRIEQTGQLVQFNMYLAYS